MNTHWREAALPFQGHTAASLFHASIGGVLGEAKAAPEYIRRMMAYIGNMYRSAGRSAIG
ncbi:MAG: hypothetical protein ACR2PG_22855 [Hyphomicrobiaceae bacterium]